MARAIIGNLKKVNAKMVPLKLNAQVADVAAPSPIDLFGPEAFAFLNHLRLVAMACRAKPRTDLFEACALLQVNRSASRDAHADALMRCLNEALGKPARLLAPGTQELTFDEQWLMRVGISCGRGDDDSRRFLLGSRVAPENRRLIGFLIGHTAEYFSLS